MNAIPRRGVLAVALALAGCASPEPAYYTLAAVPGARLAGGPRLVEVRDPSIAGYLDRSEIVRSQGSYRLELRAGERWGEPFAPMLGRVFAENLSQRLPNATVFTAHSSLTPDPQVSVEVDVQRFDLGAAGQVILRAQVAVTRSSNKPFTRTVQYETVPASAGTASLVAAMSKLLGQLADATALLVRSA